MSRATVIFCWQLKEPTFAYNTNASFHIIRDVDTPWMSRNEKQYEDDWKSCQPILVPVLNVSNLPGRLERCPSMMIIKPGYRSLTPPSFLSMLGCV
jgi:hypothetical protein